MNKQNDVGGVDVAAMLKAVDWVLEMAYNRAEAVCCGAVGPECCVSPEPKWSAEDCAIMDTLSPVRDGLRALLASPAAVGWIPVSERLPDISRAVNVYCNGADASGVAWRLPDDSWFIPEPQAIGYESITHWQPLPSPPAIASHEVGHDSAE